MGYRNSIRLAKDLWSRVGRDQAVGRLILLFAAVAVLDAVFGR